MGPAGGDPILGGEPEDGPLATIVDTTRLAVVGHSAGGSAAIQMSGDPNVATYVAMAAGNGPPPAATPGLYMAGDADVIAPAATIEQWWTTSVPSPKQLAVLGGVTHLGFMDLCTIAADQGGVFQVAERSGVAIPDVIAHLTATAARPTPRPRRPGRPSATSPSQLRSGFGIDPAPVAWTRRWPTPPRPDRPLLPVRLDCRPHVVRPRSVHSVVASADVNALWLMRRRDRRCPSTASRPKRSGPLEALRDGDVRWRGRAGPHLAYTAAEVQAVAEEAYGRYMTENALNTDVPSLRCMQQDVVDIVAEWLHGGLGPPASTTGVPRASSWP